MNVDIENTDSLLNYLRTARRIRQDEKCDVRKLGLGVSNKAQLFTRENGEQWVIKQSLVKLRVQEDWFSGQERIKIEYEGLKWLTKILSAGAVPEPIFFDESNFILCMSAVPQPHDNLRILILNEAADTELFIKLGKMLGTVHNAGRTSEEAASLFQNRSYFRTLRIEPFYEFTATKMPELKNFFNDLVGQTLRVQETVVHGDYSPKNILVRKGDVILLDYEVMHLGDPSFDIGFFLCQMLSFANHLKESKDHLLNASLEFWRSYLAAVQHMTAGAEMRAVKHTLGCLLARVKGRSPVNFLSGEEQARQVRIAGELTADQNMRIPELIETFNKRL